MPRPKMFSKQTLPVMQEMILSDGPHYAYNLAKTTGLAEATVYGILKRLAEAKYVELCWQVPGQALPPAFRITPPKNPDDPYYDLPELGSGPPRKIYQLTKEGWVFMHELRLRLEQPTKETSETTPNAIPASSPNTRS
jgi:DNA-binding PadR family transcriptional regulator